MHACVRVCLARVYLLPMFHVGVCTDAGAEALGVSGM